MFKGLIILIVCLFYTLVLFWTAAALNAVASFSRWRSPRITEIRKYTFSLLYLDHYIIIESAFGDDVMLLLCAYGRLQRSTVLWKYKSKNLEFFEFNLLGSHLSRI